MKKALQTGCRVALSSGLLVATLVLTSHAQVNVWIGEALTVQARDVGMAIDGTLEAVGTLDTRGTTITFTRTGDSGGFQLSSGLRVELLTLEQFEGTVINGPVGLRGGLNIRVAEGTVIEEGTVFTVLTCTGGCSGEFSAVLAPFAVEVLYSATSVRVVAAERYATHADGEPGFADTSFSAPAPNPFSDGTVLRLELASGSSLRIEAYDLLGRRVDTVADAYLPAGVHEFRWDAPRLASGVYLLRAQLDGRPVSVWQVRVVR